ncbi:unnamed protein product [Porites lobata]|uniref:Polycystin cation channel PKD1/PKD2 domain-containing protein n=1 Tax=Porites lobata TaxID=104759 RepID=A0ABN8P977_9CNID|nr:unnamed protein product [Porites lobata]
MAAENKPAGKGSHVSLLMHNLEESKNSEDGSDDEEEKQPGKLLAEKSRTVDDLLDEFNEAFRMKVREKYSSSEDFSWSSAADEVKVELLIESYENGGRKLSDDPLLVLLKEWPESEKCWKNPRLIESQINRLITIIFRDHSSRKYKYFKDKDELSWKTPLHLVAELNFATVARTVLRHFPGQLYVTTNPHSGNHNCRRIPVELALLSCNDDVSAFLIDNMKPERVLRLFSCEFQENPISVQELAEHSNMKKSVVAILNCMVYPDWRHLPKYKEDYSSQLKRDIELAWDSEPSEPTTYEFYYKILDGDNCGRDPSDREYSWKSKSCLASIANSTNKESIQHPVIRQLVKRKWKTFARFWFSVCTGLYVTFLLLLSFALFYGSTRDDPTQYHGSADHLRMLCEIFVVIFIVGYVADEINEMEKERLSYLKGVQFYYNLFDWLGLILILIVIPLRFSEHDAQWVLASLGFFFNVLRLFKYSCLTRTTGLYTKTLAKIVYYDIARFTGVFLVIFLAFCGAFFLSLRATNAVQVFGGFDKIMLSGVRALVEQQPAADDYSRYNWLPVVLLLIYMTAVVVILLNILIAQMSSTYTKAKKTAKLQYDVDRMLIITRLEYSRFRRFNLRLRHYQECEVIDEMTLAQDLLENSEDRSPWESIEDKLEEIR